MSLLVSLMAIGGVGCGGSSDKLGEIPKPVKILSFTVAPDVLEAAGETTVSWQTTNAAELTLTQDGEQISLDGQPFDEGSLVIAVDEDTEFELVAVGVDGSTVKETRRVLLRAPSTLPEIESFEGPEAVGVNEDGIGEVRLSWSGVKGADELILESSPGIAKVFPADAIPEGSVDVKISSDTVFTLLARNEAGTAKAEVVVRLVDLPVIEGFRVDRSWIGTGEVATFSWETEGATSVELWINGSKEEGLEPSETIGSYPAAIVFSSTIELRAFNELGVMVSAELEVSVGSPELREFLASAERLWLGESVRFDWQTAGASSFTISAPGLGSPICSPTEQTMIDEGFCEWQPPLGELELIASAVNSSGVASETWTITVGTGPAIRSFDATPSRITVGDEIFLNWQVLPDPAGQAPSLHAEDDRGNTYPLDAAAGEARLPLIVEPGPLELRLVATTDHTLSEPAVASASLEVFGRPTASLTADPPYFDDSEVDRVVLSWTSEHAASLVLYRIEEEEDEEGNVEQKQIKLLEVAEGERPAGELSFRPEETSTYLIVAKNPLDVSASAEAEVTLAPLEVLEFTADKTEAAIGEPVRLDWRTRMGQEVSLDVIGDGHYVVGEGVGAFIDVTTQGGIHLPLTQDCSRSINTSCVLLGFPGGFSFPFDGEERTEARIYSNGMLSFDIGTATGSNTLNDDFPSLNTYQYVHISPFWDSMNWRAEQYPEGNIHYLLREDSGAGRSLIVQWKDITFSTNQIATMNFEVILWEDGRFEYRYGNMDAGPEASLAQRETVEGSSATIGYQTPSKSSFHNIKYNKSINFWGPLPGRNFVYVPAPDALEKNGSYVWSPLARQATASATLKVSRGEESTNKTVSVQFINRPELSITGRPTEPITVGTSFRIGWTSRHTKALWVLDGEGNALCTPADQVEVGAGFCEITEGREGRYRYVVRIEGASGFRFDKEIDVTVYEPFEIESFTADRAIIEPGDELTLTWLTENAQTISLVANEKELLPTGAPSGPGTMVLDDLTDDTTFTLRITNSVGMVKEATVKVEIWKVSLDLLPSATRVRPGEEVRIKIVGASTGGGETPKLYGSFPLVDVSSASPYEDFSTHPSVMKLVATGSDFPQTAFADVNLPGDFSFTYFGETYRSIRVFNMGVVSFETPTGNVNNQILPSRTASYNRYHLAPFWDNLQPRGEKAAIWTAQPDADTFVIQWSRFSATTASIVDGEERPFNLNFQVVLHRDGRFEYRYGAMEPPENPGSGCQPATCANEANGSSATIGYHARAGTIGLTHHFGGTNSALANPPYPEGLSNRSFRYEFLEDGDEMVFHPERTTAYGVCAVYAGESVCRDVTIDADFGIGSFTIDADVIDFGESTVLRWTTTGGRELRILDGNEELAKITDPAEIDSGALIVKPLVNTTYRLEIKASTHTATATTSVEVVRLRMEANGPAKSTPSAAPVEITWKLTNADPNLVPVIITPMEEISGLGTSFSEMDISTHLNAVEIEVEGATTPRFDFEPDFTFNYLGSPKSSVRISSSGALTFDTGTASIAPAHTALPSTGTSAQKLVHLAPFWGRGLIGESARIFAARVDQDTYVIQWHQYSITTGASASNEYDLNYLAVLRRNGDFEFRYGSMTPPVSPGSGCGTPDCWHEANGSYTTIGYQDPGNQVGFTLNYGTPVAQLKSIPGGLSNRSWKYTYTTAATGAVKVSPWNTTNYEICALDPATGDALCADPVDVEVKWGIASFEATPWAALPTEPVNLSWEVMGLDRLRLLANGVELFDSTGSSITPKGTYAHTPGAKVTYVLEGTSAGRVVTVEREVELREFVVSATTPAGRYLPGDEITVDWDFKLAGSDPAVVAAPMFEIPAGTTDPGAYFDVSGLKDATHHPREGAVGTGHYHIELPFPFPYFGKDYSEARAYLDGYLSFDPSVQSGVGANKKLPQSTAADARIHLAVFWDDFADRGPDQLWSYSPDSKTFIIQWKAFNRVTGSNATVNYDMNFQIVLFADGSFEYRYGKLAPPPPPFSSTSCYPSTCWEEANGSSATIGYQLTDGSLGFNLFYGGNNAAEVRLIEGGLEGRSFRYNGGTRGSFKARVGATARDVEICAKSSSFYDCGVVTLRPVAEPGDLMFTELMIDPAGGAANQWFEIRNVSREPIDLSGFVVKNDRGEHKIAGPLLIPSGKLAVLASSSVPDHRADVTYGSDLVLHTSVDNLELHAGTSTITSANWDGSWQVPANQSLGLDSSYHMAGARSQPFANWCSGPVTPGAHVSCKSSFYSLDVMGEGTYFDLSEIGKPLRAFEAASQVAELRVPGFNWPFFDGAARTVWAASNGWISFSPVAPTGSATTPTVAAIPRSGVTQPLGPLVAGFWGTLRCDSTVHDCAFRYHYGDFGGRRALVMDWSNFRYSTTVGGISFQIQLWDDGDIKIVFDEVWSANDPGSSQHNNYFGNTSLTYIEGPDRSDYLVANHRQVIDLPYRVFHYKRK